MSSEQTSLANFIESIAKELSSKDLIFPSFPEITMRIRAMLNDPNVSAGEIAKIVGTEPVLSAQLLRLSNSAALCAGCHPVTDLPTAIKRLGHALVRNAAIALGIRQLAHDSNLGIMQIPLENLWQHSIQVAALSYVLAKKQTGINPDTAMLAGLLHDIGMFYILTHTNKYPDLIGDESAIKIPQQTHAQISSAILESWDIPADIISAACDHEMISRIHYAPADLTDIVMVANILAKCGLPNETEWSALPSAFGRLNLDTAACTAALLKSEQEIAQITEILG